MGFTLPYSIKDLQSYTYVVNIELLHMQTLHSMIPTQEISLNKSINTYVMNATKQNRLQMKFDNDFSLKLLIENKIKGKRTMQEGILIDSVQFWNKEGEKVYKANLEGSLGDKETNDYAKATPYKEWLLEMILGDARTLLGKFENYEVGRTSSHTWVQKEGKRILMFHTDKNYRSC